MNDIERKDNKNITYSCKRIGSSNFISGTKTHNEIFDAVDTFIPSNGDRMICVGCIFDGSNAMIVQNAYRTSSTVVTFTGVSASSGVINTWNYSDGGSSTDVISISW